MSEELYVDGLGLAPGVMETIIAIAARDVDGVASVGSSSLTGGIRSRIANKPTSQGIEISMNDADGVDVEVHIDIYYGQSIPQVASAVREAIADAITTQVGFTVSSIDVYVDGICFAD